MKATEDFEARNNGSCDVCNAPIDSSEHGPRTCSQNIAHDCYGDDYNNGGDPVN